VKISVKKLKKLIHEALLVEATCTSCGDPNAYVGLYSCECPNRKCKFFSQRQADDIEATTSSGAYAVCMYDSEGGGAFWFAKGSKVQCMTNAKKMAALLNIDVCTQDDVDAEPFEADGRPIVLSSDNDLIIGSSIRTIVDAPGDSYNAGTSVMFDVNEGTVDADPAGMQPTKPTKFKPGDNVILAQFAASSPGGFVIVDMNMSTQEYWQEGTVENTFPDSP